LKPLSACRPAASYLETLYVGFDSVRITKNGSCAAHRPRNFMSKSRASLAQCDAKNGCCANNLSAPARAEPTPNSRPENRNGCRTWELTTRSKKEPEMAQQPNPNQRHVAPEDRSRQIRLDEDSLAGPDRGEGIITGGRVAAFAVGIGLLIAAAFYGMNMTATAPNQPVTASQSTPAGQSPTPGVRDVTPSNSRPGTTTGAAPSRVTPGSPDAAPRGDDGASSITR